MKSFFKKLVAVILIILVFGQIPMAGAATLSDLEKQRAAAAAKAAEAKRQAEQKATEAAAIQAQMNEINRQVKEAQAALDGTNGQINSTETLITDLNTQISAQEETLNKEQEKMGKVLSAWYMEGDNSGLFSSIINSSSLSEAITKEEYYDSIRQQIELSMEKINKIKSELVSQRTEADQKKAQLVQLRQSQTDQKNFLANRASMQRRLLSDTKNALSELQTEQKAASQLASQLQAKIDSIIASSTGAGGDVVSVSASWYYSQLDSRWSDYRIGRYATIGDYGCLLTSLTMVANYYNRYYDPITAAQHSSFNTSGGSQDGAMYSTSIVSDGGSQAINWNLLDNELADGHPVVVGVALGVDMGNSFGVSHFVVIKSKLDDGKYGMLDPLGGGRGYAKNQVKAMRIIR